MQSDPADRRARFEAIVDAVYEPLQRYARRRADRDAAEDLVADTLLVVWRRLDDVPEGAVLPWCYRVAAGCLANQRRSARRQARLRWRVATVDPPAPGGAADPLPDPGLHAALATLSAADQEVLRLWAWESLAPGEVATALGITANAASIRLHRAKARLAAALERNAGHADTGSTRTEEVT